MQDPTHTGGPPPAYLLESEDEDDLFETDQDLSPSDRSASSLRAQSQRLLRPDAVVEIVGLEKGKGNHLIFLVGQAGETVARELMRPDSTGQCDGYILVDNVKVSRAIVGA